MLLDESSGLQIAKRERQADVGGHVARILLVAEREQFFASADATRDGREQMALGAHQAAGRIGEFFKVALERTGEKR